MTKPITLNRRTVLAGATAAGALSLAPGMTLAAGYPTRPVTVVVP